MPLRFFRYGKYSYQYQLEYEDRKSFSLVIYPNLSIILKAPIFASEDDIKKFLIKKWSWLEKNLSEMKKYQKKHFARQYITGETYYYLDKTCMLYVEKSSEDSVKMVPGRIIIYTTKKVDDGEHNKILLEKWFAAAAHRIFKQEYYKIIRDFKLKTYPLFDEREMSKRWGSYQKSGKILINPKLIQAPRSAIRYVFLHELCHIDNPNHDQKFYSKLTLMMPEWKDVKEKLEVRFG